MGSGAGGLNAAKGCFHLQREEERLGTTREESVGGKWR